MSFLQNRGRYCNGSVKLPKAKRGEITLKKICNATEHLFSQKGYYDTEVHDITQRAEAATGTFVPISLARAAHYLLLQPLNALLRRNNGHVH